MTRQYYFNIVSCSMMTLAFLSHPGTAWADDACPTQPITDSTARDLASEWFSIGSTDVANGNYIKGSESFLCSYQLLPHASSLLNAALAAQKGGDDATACRLYQKFISISDDSSKNHLVSEEIQKLHCPSSSEDDAVPLPSPLTGQQATESDGANANSPAENPSNTTTASMPPVPVPSRIQPVRHTAASSPAASVWPYTLGNVLLIGGSVSLLTGTVFQLLTARAKSKGEKTDDADQFRSYSKDVEQFQTAAYIGVISGGVLLISGVTLRLLFRTMNRRETYISGLFTGSSNGGIQLTTKF